MIGNYVSNAIRIKTGLCECMKLYRHFIGDIEDRLNQNLL